MCGVFCLVFALKFIEEKYFDTSVWRSRGEKRLKLCVRKDRTKIKDRIQNQKQDEKENNKNRWKKIR
jgi:hypothetical protein